MHIEEYKTLMQAFLDEKLSPKEFETAYLSAFKSQPDDLDEATFAILSDVFWAVDQYWEEIPAGKDTNLLISEERLRHEVSRALQQLHSSPSS
jgi:hypothetical protein